MKRILAALASVALLSLSGAAAYADDSAKECAQTAKLTFGWQAGAQGYSMILFVEDERAFNEFASGNFEFGAGTSAVVITAAAYAGAGSGGAAAGASGGKKDAATAGGFHKGVAPFAIIKGGLMYEAVLSGAKFSFKKL